MVLVGLCELILFVYLLLKRCKENKDYQRNRFKEMFYIYLEMRIDYPYIEQAIFKFYDKENTMKKERTEKLINGGMFKQSNCYI